MEQGFIYTMIKYIIENLKWLNLVELFKYLAKKIGPSKKVYSSRIAVDIFITLKWFFVLYLWVLKINTFWTTFLIWYLILTNIYTYFYYHVWCDESLNTDSFDKNRIRRRFINLFLAISFSNISFAYLYYLPYSTYLNWTTGIGSLQAIWFSISNSFAANYDAVKPSTGLGNSVTMIQLMITFIFVTIIVSRSIPQTSSKE